MAIETLVNKTAKSNNRLNNPHTFFIARWRNPDHREIVGLQRKYGFSYGEAKDLWGRKEETENQSEERRKIIEPKLKENRTNGRLKKKVIFSGNKGGVGKTTLKVQTLAATVELLEPLNYDLRIVGLEADTPDPQVGNHMSQVIREMTGDVRKNPFLKFFRTEVPEAISDSKLGGFLGGLLLECLYRVPEHPVLWMGAVPEDGHCSDTLGEYTKEGDFYKLARAFRHLDADLTYVDVRPGKTPHEVLSFWHESDVKIASQTAVQDSIISVMNLIESSQRATVLHNVRREIIADYSKKISNAEQGLEDAQELLGSKTGGVESLDDKIGPLQSQLTEAEGRRKSLTGEIRKERKAIDVLKGDQLDYGEHEETLISLEKEKEGLNTRIRGYRKELKPLQEERGECEREIGDLTSRCERHGVDIQRYKTELEERKAVLKGFYSLEKIREGLRELNVLGGYSSDPEFSRKPTIIVPNIIGTDMQSDAEASYDAIVKGLDIEGFPIENIFYVNNGRGNKNFYIPDHDFVRDSKDRGLPLVFDEDERIRYSEVADCYRTLAWNILGHIFNLNDGGHSNANTR